MARVALVIMARYPAVGKVKTRLARTIGAQRACDLYQAFLRDLGHRFSGGRRELIWAFHPPESDFAARIGATARCLPQAGNGLAQRMHNCFRRLCAEGYEKVILIGADAPHVHDEWLDQAERALDSADVVLGPSDDGGYYLIAMRQPHDVFTGIAMSTARVLAETVAKAEAAALKIALLTQTFDVDEAEDLARLRRLLADGSRPHPRLPHTAALLRGWGDP